MADDDDVDMSLVLAVVRQFCFSCSVGEGAYPMVAAFVWVLVVGVQEVLKREFLV